MVKNDPTVLLEATPWRQNVARRRNPRRRPPLGESHSKQSRGHHHGRPVRKRRLLDVPLKSIKEDVEKLESLLGKKT